MKKIVKILVILALISGGYFAYKKFGAKDEAPKILTTKMQKGNIRGTVTATGEVYAQELVDVGAQVGGQIKKLYVKVGDVVKAGDMIAQIDSVTQENNIAKEKAQLNIYEANLVSAKIASDNAQIQYNRELKLYKANATSKEALENAKNNLAAKEAAKKQIEAQIEQTKLSLSTAETNLGYTKITAPTSGTIVSVPVEEGKTVNANQTTPTIAKIADLSKMEIKMEVAEGDISKISVGTPVEYYILSNLNDVRQAHVSHIDPGLTTLSDGSYDKASTSASSSKSAVYFYVKSLIDNRDNYLKIGMTTECEIIVNHAEDTNYLPTSVIKRDEKGDYVMVKRGFGSEKTYIKKGISDDLNTEILGGLSDDDEIIIADGSNANQIGDGRGGRAPRMRF
ncbi:MULTISPECIES: efflux RND transporter periplasmic adaptor subunit [unclassified Campylobacter]|uniref:efflux RND transporter periplasmic adaptor subunit n=1 Tax=unclassified Campylobacter TaxID=2593542 RepID=UPI0022E9F668|nr:MULTISPECIES: efflux RND transporter periplasmic adaptor subunit [unclassified Campylobacter]MDA3053850.1 efflux RND transporter periplasmic adaptor subunit [Campylobacter sp. VBCF_07 NA4]MDA3060261.1 efflux RND transporter periplasmic adaptor subunit [Campylobacter sp. VBCF_02 NA5]MDA3069777.1 efflux RND transporter periplasmic adaptor subunit [Campylobacter sp. VBCF_08 NA3]WBR54895.1 efflux RND transporter periplasmic adaptor subunit [Campylobacter sp. VBCF_01 NA2]